MKLDGGKIFLRHPVADDAGLMLNWENDSDIWSSGDNRSPYVAGDILDFISRGQDLRKFGQERFMICTKENSGAIGCIDLYDYDEFHSRAGVGILIYEPELRNRGFGREALKVLIDYCMKPLLMKQLYCHTLTDNRASIMLFSGAGFTVTGTKWSWRKIGLEWKDEHIMQLILN